MSLELSDFESNIMRLLIVALRFQGIHHEFPNQMKDSQDTLLVRGILREYAIIQLHNFLIIRDDLLTEPRFKKLDDVIKPMIQPILDNREGIKQMRHNYVAHIQERGRNFRIMMNDIVQQYNLPTTWAAWSYFTGLAWFYYGVVDKNFDVEMTRANQKYDAKVGHAMTVSIGFEMDDVDKKIQELYWPVALELDNQDLKSTFSPEDLEKIKKIVSNNQNS